LPIAGERVGGQFGSLAASDSLGTNWIPSKPWSLCRSVLVGGRVASPFI